MGLYQKLFLYFSALALLAQCQPGKQDGEHDEYGALTQDKDKMQALHRNMDIDGDGKLSLNEVIEYSQSTFKVMAAPSSAEAMEMWDTNKDGKVSYKEWTAIDRHYIIPDPNMPDSAKREMEEERVKDRRRKKNKFEAADLNKDGKLDEREIGHMQAESPQFIKALASASVKRKDQNGDGKLDSKEWGDDAEMKGIFAELDVDGDGTLTAEELYRYESGEYEVHSAFRALFAGADTDKDSHLSLDEFHKHMPLMQESDAAMHMEQWMQHLEL